MHFRVWLAVLLLAGWVLAACTSENEFASHEACDGELLADTTQAAGWARERAGIAHYHHIADLKGGQAEVRLLDAQEKPLGTMVVRQSYGDPMLPDGVMHARLAMGAGEALELVERGAMLGVDEYQVDMQLTQGARGLRLLATFAHEACQEPAGRDDAPACAGELAMQQLGVLLPSCGLIGDEFVRNGRPVTLKRLRYEVDASAGVEPTLGAVAQVGDSQRWSIDLLDQRGQRPVREVQTWLGEVGLSDWMDDPRVTLLSTAFLDRTWWRSMEQQLAHCAVVGEGMALSAEVAPMSASAQTLRQRRQSLCPGQTDARDWANSGGGQGNAGGRGQAGLWGDPHLTTLDGDAYDFQGAGEYILVESTTDDSMRIQSRFEPGLTPSEISACNEVTYATAVATVVDGYRVVVEARPAWRVLVDGAQITSPAQLPTLTTGAALRMEEGGLEVVWPDGSWMRVSGVAGELSIDITLSQRHRGLVRGLLGNFNGQREDERMLPDGTILAMPLSFEELYHEYGPQWLVSAETTLFDYEDGQDTDDFRLWNFPSAPVRFDDLPAQLREEARVQCEAGGVVEPGRLAACVMDTVCSASQDFVADAAHAPRLQTQASADENVWMQGDIHPILAPAQVRPALPEAPRCLPRTRPSIAMLQEGGNKVLAQDLLVHTTHPGTYAAADDLRAQTLAAGSEVRSYLLVREETAQPAGPLRARVRFSVPILGLILDDPAASDAALGAEDSVYHADQFAPILWENDRFELGSDGQTLDIHWGSNAHGRLRVLTEPIWGG